MSPVGLVFLLLGALFCSVQCCVVIHTGKLPNSFLQELVAQQGASLEDLNMMEEEGEKPPRLHAEATTKKSSEEERSGSKRKKSMSLLGSLTENPKVSEDDENVDTETALYIAEKFRKMYDALLGKMKKSDEGGGLKKTFKSKNRKEQKRPMYDMDDEEKLKSLFFPDKKDNPFYYKYASSKDD